MIPTRRRALLAGAALAGAAAGLARAQPRPSFAAGDPALRPTLLAQGEAALERGDASAALEAFERAALILHAADAEMGIVRAMVQEGGYRRALAFAAHAAGAHRDAPAASALYAWLLAIGGQGTFARRVLDEAEARSVGDPLPGQTRRALAQALATVPAPLLVAPQRAAPYTLLQGDEAPAAPLRGLGSGALLDGGRVALVPLLPPTPAPSGIWLRNGLGRTARADVESASPVLGVALLRLRTPIDTGPVAPAPAEPFAGSAGAVLAMAPGDGTPAWPWLFDGFLGGADPALPLARRLLFDVPSPCGGAVFDAGAHLAGIALAEAPTRRWLPMSALRVAFGAALGPQADTPGTRRPVGTDELYERAQKQVVQLLA